MTIPWLVLNQYCSIPLGYLWSEYTSHQLLGKNPILSFFPVRCITSSFLTIIFKFNLINISGTKLFLPVPQVAWPLIVSIFFSKHFHIVFGDSLQSPIYALHLLPTWISGKVSPSSMLSSPMYNFLLSTASITYFCSLAKNIIKEVCQHVFYQV